MRSPIHRLRKESFVILGAMSISLLLGTFSIFRKLESPSYDLYVRFSATKELSDIAIVCITDNDYRQIFSGRSPLDPQKLKTVIDAIARGNPSAIGVDIDTSSLDFQRLVPSRAWPPIIWARNAVFSNREGKHLLFAVLGGQSPPYSGVISFKVDPDKTLRSYTDYVNTSAGSFPTFPRAVVSALANDNTLRAGKTYEELLIKFSRGTNAPNRYKLPASMVLNLSEGEGWMTEGPLTGRIVLLGGDYNASDEHLTPLGWMLGVEVLANIVETEMGGGGIRPPNKYLLVVLAAMNAIILLVLFHFFGLRNALLITLFATPVLSLGCSYLLSGSFFHWVYFTLILLCILTHILATKLHAHIKQHLPSSGPGLPPV